MDIVRPFPQLLRSFCLRLKRRYSQCSTKQMILILIIILILPVGDIVMFPIQLLTALLSDPSCPTPKPRESEGEVNYLEFELVSGAPMRRLCVVDGDQFPRRANEERIVFHDSTGSDCLSNQQACAIEAAAHSNPDRVIHVYMMTSELNETCPAFRALAFYDNVQIVLIDGDSYFELTPLGQWYFSRQWEESEDPAGHLNHMMRLLSLWKAGGLVLTFDQWLLADMDEPWWPVNFIVQDSSKRPLIDQVASFEHKHPLVEQLMKAANATYRQKGWARERAAAYRHLVVNFRETKNNEKEPKRPRFNLLGPGQFYPDFSASSDDLYDSIVANRTVASIEVATLNKNETLRSKLIPDVCPHSYISLMAHQAVQG